jgi:uncharacterized protein (DUF305 family)
MDKKIVYAVIIIVLVIILFFKSGIINSGGSGGHKGMDHSTQQSGSGSGSNPCTDTLTDLEYLEHMIPHHQVAIDMSNLLVPVSQNPQMLHLCRDITRKQTYEIWEMSLMKKKLTETMFNSQRGSIDRIYTVLDKFNPIMSKSKDGSCNPLFFKPNDHSKMMMNMKVSDRSYLEHMIPHHQVAIDMSKRLLLHTNNSYLLVFCRKLIVDQQSEIYLMNNLLNNTYNYTSLLL